MHVTAQFAKYSFSTSRVNNNKISNNNSNDNDLSRWLTSALILTQVYKIYYWLDFTDGKLKLSNLSR